MVLYYQHSKREDVKPGTRKGLCIPKTQFSLNQGRLSRCIRGRGMARRGGGMGTGSLSAPLSSDGGGSTVPAMRAVLVALVVTMVSVLRSRASLHPEVLALRHQLAVFQSGMVGHNA